MHFNEKEFIWAEKFRPNTIKDVILPPKIKQIFEKFIEKKEIQNLVLHSTNPGSGKTTSAYALSNDIGCSKPLFINASLDTSIDIIRNDVYEYCSHASLINKAKCKVVILDECERLSLQGLNSLKGLFESVSKNARFIMTTNDLEIIPEPLLSRCLVISYEFDDADELFIMKHLFQNVVNMLDQEKIEYELPAIAQVIKLCKPDCRKIINELQTLSLYGKIDMSAVQKVSVVDTDALVSILKAQDYVALKTFVMANQKKFGKSFFSKFFGIMDPVIVDQTSPALVQILGDAQKYFSKVPDLYIFWLDVMVRCLIDIQFK